MILRVRYDLWRIWFGASIGCLLLVGCSSESRDLFEQSHATVLVPLDTRFSDGWTIHLEDSANNYIFANGSVEYGQAPDPDDDIFGYQINDITLFEGGLLFGEELKPLLGTIARSEAGLENYPPWCQAVSNDSQITRCELPVSEYTAEILATTADNGSVVLVSGQTNVAALDYLAGDFREVEITEARKYLVDGPFGSPVFDDIDAVG